jgi:hypothetical protein
LRMRLCPFSISPFKTFSKFSKEWINCSLHRIGH